MMGIEEYILKRKKEDNIDELDFSKRKENLKIFVDYIFEYFNGYLDVSEIQYQKIVEGKKLAKYRETLGDFSKELQDWMVKVFEKNKCYINRRINDVLRDEELFLVYDTDAEFNKLSYKCYSQLIKKNPFLENDIDRLNEYIREYQVIKTTEESRDFDFKGIKKLEDWVTKTREKYGINLIAFVDDYCMCFSSTPNKWDKRKLLDPTYKIEWYDHRKSKNLLGVDTLYPKISNKPYFKGKKKELLCLLVICYFSYSNITSDDEFLNNYLKIFSI